MAGGRLSWYKMSSVFIILSLCLQITANAQPQTTESLLSYLHGVRTKGALLLNVRGYEITVDQAAGNFSRPYFQQMFPGFGLHQVDKAVPDSSFGIKGLHIEKQVTRNDVAQYVEYYFFQKNADTILGILISSSKLPDKTFKLALVNLVLHNGIPDTLISDITPPVLLFAGRSIPVDNRCRWMGPNVLQCHGFGEMNWSMHPDMNEAKAQTALQEAVNRRNRQFKIEQEEDVSVRVEGVMVPARRLQLRVKGIVGLMAKGEGSRTLIVYYVTTEVRGRYVSCVLSYWTSDYLEDSGLPPLLGTIMQLK